MKYKEIDESPQEVPPTNFNFDDPVFNKEFVKEKLKRVKEVIEQTPEYKIVLTGNNVKGWIFLYNFIRNTMDYCIEYETKTIRNGNIKTVTQCILWRNKDSLHVRGLTKRMFFDYLLKKYPAIMSDRLQTIGGNDFWRARMADAVLLGHKVGIWYISVPEIIWYDKTVDGDYVDWIADKDTFGKENKYASIRYLIAK